MNSTVPHENRGFDQVKADFGNPTVTPGTPGMNDGVAAQIFMKREKAESLTGNSLHGGRCHLLLTTAHNAGVAGLCNQNVWI